MDILHQPIFLLLVIIILGEAIGKIEVKAFSFGSSAIIFVALVFGHYGFSLPKEFLELGLVLFIYSIGLQAGPGFLNSFKSHGLKLTMGAIVVVTVGFLTTLIASLFLGYGGDTAAGAFSGSLTSTPGLAVAVEMTKSAMAPAAYGLTYSYGVIGVILFVKLIPRFTKTRIPEEEERLRAELLRDNPPVTFIHLEISNPNVVGKPVKDLALTSIAPIAITRLLRKGSVEPELVNAETVLGDGDQIRVVGTEQDLKQISLVLGHPVSAKMEFNSKLMKKKIIVSKKAFIGRTIGSINFAEVFNVQVSRLTRNSIDIPADPTTRIQMGDVIHLVGMEQSLENMKKLLGNDARVVYTTSVFSVLAGIFLGYLIGKIPVYLPLVGEITLGTTGGVLLSGLILSSIYQTGPVIWAIPETGNGFIRELGLLLFLATVGTSAGATIMDTIAAEGVSLLLAGVVITTIPMIVAYIFCKSILKIQFLRILGVITGGMTSTPGLATTTSISATSFAATAYATVYPVALIGMIIYCKVLVWVLG